MILALINNLEKFQFLVDELEQQNIQLFLFNSVSDLKRKLEVTPELSGLVVDFSGVNYQDFLIRFSLRYPEIPILSLKEQSSEQLSLRLRAFISRLSLPQKKLGNGKILLVDDSKTIQLQYAKLLRASGYTVDTANNAEKGFQKALSKKYDLAIVDYFMPGDNGAKLCKKLQSHEDTYELVCAILTAQYKQDVVDDCLKSGALECMFKNESYDLFLIRVSSLIRGVERKRQVERERSRLIGLLYSVAEGVYGVTPDGRIQFVNPATLKLLGQPLVELLGHFPHECIHPIDNGGQETSFEHCFLQQAYMFGDELRAWRTLFQRSDGSHFPVECNVMMLGDAEHNDGSVVVFRDISEQQRLENNWQWQLSHDHLTGLLNRSAFEELLNRELNRIKRTKETALLFFIDLDKFKLINDQLGHAAGDQLLINLSESLKHSARSYDHVGRLSGDEFVVLLTQVNIEEIQELAERYRSLLESTSLSWEGESHIVTGSIGVAILDQSSESVGDMLANADHACHQAKLKGRNQWAIYNENTEVQTELGNWHQRLSKAMKDERFVLLQLPIFDIDIKAKIVGTNCLLRLKEKRALISPAVFMSNAKRFEMNKKIDRTVLEILVSFCRQQKQLQSNSWYSLTLSIEALSDDVFRKSMLKLWSDSGLKPSSLRFEIGEEELFNFPQWKKHLAQIRKSGFGVIISHFGMNTQSVLNLPQLPIDAIKLDTSLTRELAVSPARRHLIDAIVKTCKQCHIDVIATHVESEVELELLKARSVNGVQGFYLQKPEVLK